MSSVAPPATVPAGDARRCAECGNLLVGRYCSGCGQEADIQLPTFREFLHEAVGEHIALEGKLFRTLWVLVRSPGQLTTEYVAGRRQRYLKPLRLYLTLSLLFFLVLGLTSKAIFYTDSNPPPTHKDAATKTAVAGSPAATEKAGSPGGVTKGGDINIVGPGGSVFQASDDDTTGSRYLDDKLHSFSRRSEAEKSRALTDSLEHGAPYAIFVLMPLFAAGLKLLYVGSGRTYGEHFLFALHAQSYAYLVMLIGRINRIPLLGDYEGLINAVVALAMIFYLYFAMRRFYGRQRWPTLWRMSLLLAAYGTMLGIALTLITLLAVFD